MTKEELHKAYLNGCEVQNKKLKEISSFLETTLINRLNKGYKTSEIFKIFSYDREKISHKQIRSYLKIKFKGYPIKIGYYYFPHEPPYYWLIYTGD